MSWFHPEEAAQIGAVLDYHDAHPDGRMLIEFGDGESYLCTFFTGYESENTGDLDIEMDDPRYDEFYQIWFTVLRIVKPGSRGSATALTVDYRDFPSSIIDADTGAIVYPSPEPMSS